MTNFSLNEKSTVNTQKLFLIVNYHIFPEVLEVLKSL